MVDVALPVLIGQSDLVVVGSVTANGKKGNSQVKIATMKNPFKSYFQAWFKTGQSGVTGTERNHGRQAADRRASKRGRVVV